MHLSALGKSQKKQVDLARKLDLLKNPRKNDHGSESANDAKTDNGLDTTIQHDATRSEFVRLLATYIPPPETKRMIATQPPVFDKLETEQRIASKPKNPAPRRKKAANAPSQTESLEDIPLDQGDTAKRRHFEPLISVSTKLPLGPIAAAQLVPWVPPYLSRYLIAVADPRRQSAELRAVLQVLMADTGPEVLSNMVAIVADAPEETNA